MHNNAAVGDASNDEERLLQDRMTRILIGSNDDSDLVFLYHNDAYSKDPPSCSLFADDDALSEETGESESADSIKAKGFHNMFPKLVVSKILDDQSERSYQVEDIVTRVYLPSEEFAQVIELNPFKRFCSRMWSWCKRKTNRR